MSAASANPSASPAATDAVPATADGKKTIWARLGKKKLILIGVALAVLLAGGGGGAFFVMKKRAAAAAAAAEDGGDAAADKHEEKAAKADVKHAPVFVPLDPFTVNLADRDAERYVQIGMTLELADAKAGDLLKAYMPAIRNNILLTLAGKTAGQLMEHQGKLQLAAEVRAAALKPLGYEVKAAAGAAKRTDAEGDEPPIRAVHFSNFIIQ
jgi:flagellar protein FliL